jgi:hypothetical protein
MLALGQSGDRKISPDSAPRAFWTKSREQIMRLPYRDVVAGEEKPMFWEG